MKTKDRRVKQEVRGVKPEVKKSGRGGKQSSPQELAAREHAARERAKRSGIDAVKLHLEVTGGTGRTSRSATSVRKTSIRMTAIKEYPFDLSDLNQKGEERQKSEGPAPGSPSDLPPPPLESALRSRPSVVSRKVSIMADDSSKDRENLPEAYADRNTRMTAIKEYPFDLSDVNQKDKERQRSEGLAPGSPSDLPPPLESAYAGRNGRVSAQAEGPSRRKSNLHNAMAADMDSSWDRQTHIEGRFKKYSTTSSVYSKKALSQQSEHIERSWWYACCAKCHQEESGIPSWEPPNWQKVCPYPLCPSYRQFAQTVAVFLIGIMVWVTVWIVMGDTAAPGGQLFMLVVLTLASYFGGWLMMKITTLPALIGMLVVGIVLKNVGFVDFDETYLKVGSYVRKVALTIILTRAGLDLDPNALKKFFFTVIKLALLPWIFECCLCAIMSHYLLGLPWDWSFLLGSIIAAVSPAVIVPCLFRLRGKGYGVSKGIPTLVLAVAGVDDAASVAAFGIVTSFMFGSSSLTMNIVQGPLSVFGGIAFGVLCGYLVRFVPERNDAFLVPLRVLLLLAGGLMSVLGSEEVGWGGAGPLAVIAFAFVACKNWTEQGWELEDNPVATAFEIFWMLFEPMLFGITGSQVVIRELPIHLVLVGGGILLACMVLRALLTSAAAVRSNLNTKEKFFVGLAWMAKATVQAALGPVALDEVKKLAGEAGPSAELVGYAETVITVCIMSIVITAPIGAIVITIAGPRLLSKTSKPPVLEGWRRSHRPSIRDISIIDEEETGERDAEADDPSPAPASPVTPASPHATPAAYSTPAPITVQPNHRT